MIDEINKDIDRLASLNIPEDCEMHETIQRAIKALELYKWAYKICYGDIEKGDKEV